MSARTRKAAQQRRAEKERARTARTRLLAVVGGALAVSVTFGAFALLGGAPTPSGAADPAWFGPQPADVVYGRADAPVTVVEYASLTCSHCARFHAGSLDAFVEGWVDTGRARLVYRPFPLDGDALAAASAVGCMPEADRAEAVGRLYRTVSEWTGAGGVAEAAARGAGLSPASLARTLSCLAEGGAEERVLEGMRQARGRIDSTPSFAVAPAYVPIGPDGGQVYSGFMSADALGRVVDSMPKPF